MKIVGNFDLTADRLRTFNHFRLTSVMNGINFKQLNVVLRTDLFSPNKLGKMMRTKTQNGCIFLGFSEFCFASSEGVGWD